MKCIIVDGDDMARRSLSRMVEKVEDVTVVASCKDIPQAIRNIDRTHIDLAFIDTRAEGIESLKDIRNNAAGTQLIFITHPNNPNEAIYDLDAADFLSQPLSPTRIEKAVERLRRRKRMVEPKADTPDLYVKVNGRLLRILHQDIRYIEQKEDLTILHTREASLETDAGFSELAQKLSSSHFLKVNRHYIINLHEVLEVGETSISLADLTIQVTRAKRPLIMHYLDHLKKGH